MRQGVKRRKLTQGAAKTSGENELTDQEENGEEIQENLPRLQTLVAELLIRSITSVNLLKTCRLVNRFWNSEACLALQKNSVTKLREEDSRLRKFHVAQVGRAFGALAGTPSPFQYFDITATGFKESFFNVVMCPNILTKTLSINMDEDRISWIRFELFLKSKMNELTQLKFSDFNSYDIGEVFEEIRFPSLNSLDVRDGCGAVECDHLSFLGNALQDSAVSTLEIKIDSSRCFHHWLTLNFSRIEELNLELNNIGDDCWEALSTVELPLLKKLFIYCEDDAGHGDHLISFLKNVASSLVFLEHNFFCELENLNFVFPTLKQLTIPARFSSVFEKMLTPTRFPKLKELSLTSCTVQSLKFIEDGIKSHDGIEKFWIDFHSDELQDEIYKVFPTAVIKLGKQYPNILDFQIEMEFHFTSSFLLYIHHAFPNLKALHLLGPIDFCTLSGLLMEEVDEYLDSGQNIENIPRRNSILDFKDLESLDFDLVDISTDSSNYTTHYCLSLLPKLKFLRFPWKPEMSCEIIGSCLKHLTDLEISNSRQYSAAVQDLKGVLPNCNVH